jgi:4-amino-4-deoxy-L-arabinose transferase-like glycosyltransferase
MDMHRFQSLKNVVWSDLGILVLLALAWLVFHTLTNGQYGFHRDELDMLDSARHPDWGYVAYPPLTPLLTRVALELFGTSLAGLRFPAALAQAITMVLTGLMARELGGSRLAQVVAALGAAIAPIVLMLSSMLHYVSFDYLWWVVIAYLMVRLLKTEDPRWWLGIGAAIGLGLLTKYTMAFWVAGIVGGVVLTRVRRYLLSPWLWAGVVLSVLIFLPNLIWQMQHHFISLDFLNSIHARDVRIGRTANFLVEQFYVCTNVVTVPLWGLELYFFFGARAGQRYRPLGWMFLIPFAQFLVAQGRGYYLSPAYPMLIGAGAAWGERQLASLSAGALRVGRALAVGLVAISGAVFAALVLPLAPVNSAWWNLAVQLNPELREEIGWPELVGTVAQIYATLPADAKTLTTIFADNYGEAGAINLYGTAYGLPEAISGMNSYWLRGYGNPAAQTVIILGGKQGEAEALFDTCRIAGRVSNPYAVVNEEIRDHFAILLCQGPHFRWPDIWQSLQRFG